LEKILLVEDDSTLLEVLSYNLRREGYQVVTAMDGIQALDQARRENPDLIILDIMLPELDGLEVCRILRREMTVPILMLTAKGEEIDKVVGLELGADDYMTKPFSLRELLARVHAMLRRADMLSQKVMAAPPTMKAGDLEIDLARHQVARAGSILDLSPKEFDVLAFLVKNRGITFTRDQLLERVWGYESEVDTRTVDVHIRWLRQKIESNPGKPRHLLTVRGVGYRFEG